MKEMDSLNLPVGPMKRLYASNEFRYPHFTESVQMILEILV